jgi:hypothetical protein
MSFDEPRNTPTMARTSTDLAKGNDDLPPPPSNEPLPSHSDPERKGRLDGVLQSDIGINTLLNRLKQSISSTKDFASFLKKRSAVEEEHAQGLKRLNRGTHDLIRRPENRQGSFAQSYEELIRTHDRMAEHGLQFGSLLQQMSNDLNDLAANIDRGRKQWKTDGLAAEKKVQDSESALDKAKTRYDSLAEQYDRARTGDRQSGRFGIKGPKSAAQQEEDLQRKVQTADSEYFQRVQTAQSNRQELTSTHRPQAVKALQDLIAECDSGLSMHLAKYASANEKLLLNNGLCVSPLKSQAAGASSGPRSLREIAQQVNNQKDLEEYVLGFSNKAGTRPPEIKYVKHPALASPKQTQAPQFPPSQQSYNTPQPSYGAGGAVGPPGTGSMGRAGPGHQSNPSGQISGVTPFPQSHQRDGSFQGPPGPYGGTPNQMPGQIQGSAPQLPPMSMSGGLGSNPTQTSTISPMSPNNEYRPVVSPMNQNAQQSPSMSRPDNLNSPVSTTSPSYGAFGQSDIPGSNFRGPSVTGPGNNVRQETLPGSMNNRQGNGGQPGGPPYGPSNNYGPDSRGPSGVGPGVLAGAAGMGSMAAVGAPGNTNGNHRPTPSTASSQAANGLPSGPQSRRADMQRPNLPPLNPVFGVSLDDLFKRDNSAVPMIVYQCVQAVDLFGLDVEGIYRTSGSAPHIMEMKAMFDNGALNSLHSATSLMYTDSSQVDFRNPASFHHDIASVTTLLKHFLRDLPDPLLTSASYTDFITAAKIDDDISRRDSLHAVINGLPDPNYATLRVITLHLARVAEHSGRNRMTPSNLAICFGPTLLGQAGGPPGAGDIRDAGWQARVVETILTNTFQIFDDDD